MKKKPSIIDENTRFNLKFSNIYALLAMVIMLAFTFAAFDKRVSRLEDKMDILIASQKELKQDFGSWKKQAEDRLGTVESRQDTVISYVENHLQVRIIK